MFGARPPSMRQLNNENRPNIVGISYFDQPWIILVTLVLSHALFFVANVSPTNNSSTATIDIFCSAVKSEF